ncbi:unnamed protein product, partial [Rotaria sp. Silwood1]
MALISNIYIQESATRGKVVLDTTVGDIEIELFSKECPLACRNFVQLCMDGYYDATVFHRVVPNFIAQGGDPTGTSEGGESATSEFFQKFYDEFHTFLRFNRRDLVGMVNQGPHTNVKEKIIAETPVHKHKIIKAEIISNPFDNMVARPRTKPQIIDDDETNKKSKDIVHAKAIKNYGLLSLGNEAEEEEEELTNISM